MPKLREVVHMSTDRLSQQERQTWQEPSELSVAKQIQAAVNDQPGISYRQLSNRLPKISVGAISGNLSTLAKNGKLKRKQLDWVYRYYPANFKWSSPVKTKVEKPEKAAKGAVEQALIQYVSTHPGLRAKELAIAVNCYLGTVYNAAARGVIVGRNIKKDGILRYFLPSQLNLPSKPETPVLPTPATPATPAETSNSKGIVERLAMQYVWETGQDSSPLKDFVDWIK